MNVVNRQNRHFRRFVSRIGYQAYTFENSRRPTFEPLEHRLLLTTSPRAGDANRDWRFDQLDIVQVLNVGKYLSDGPAVWEEGDWNSDGVFNQLDIVAALLTGNYLANAKAALAPGGALNDDQTSLVYDAGTCESSDGRL